MCVFTYIEYFCPTGNLKFGLGDTGDIQANCPDGSINVSKNTIPSIITTPSKDFEKVKVVCTNGDIKVDSTITKDTPVDPKKTTLNDEPDTIEIGCDYGALDVTDTSTNKITNIPSTNQTTTVKIPGKTKVTCTNGVPQIILLQGQDPNTTKINAGSFSIAMLLKIFNARLIDSSKGTAEIICPTGTIQTSSK